MDDECATRAASLKEKAAAKALQQAMAARRMKARPRALVTTDLESGAQSWFACSLVCGAKNDPQPLITPCLRDAATKIASMKHTPVLATAEQARQLRSESTPIDNEASQRAVLYKQESDPPGASYRTRLAITLCRRYSEEYVYVLDDLVSCRDRSFRKACRRMEVALNHEGLVLQIYPGGAMTKDIIGQCMRCRNTWERRRAVDRSSKQVPSTGTLRVGRRIHLPPKRNYYLSAAMRHNILANDTANPSIALFVILRPLPKSDTVRAPQVIGYLLTECVGHTVVAVDGLHDFSVRDKRADPSAWLLHRASQWWTARVAAGQRAVPPVWLNDGPVPTPGLLAYKAQYHGFVQPLMLLHLQGAQASSVCEKQ